MFVGIALDKVNNQADRIYTYFVPDHLVDKAKIGARVTVPFGRGNTVREGIILTVDGEETQGVKPVLSVVDGDSVVGKSLLDVAEFVRETAFCTRYQALCAMLPLGVRIKLKATYEVANGAEPENDDECSIFDTVSAVKEKDEVEKLLSKEQLDLLEILIKSGKILKHALAEQNGRDLKIKSACLAVSEDEALAYIAEGKNRAKQEKVIDILLTGDSVPVTELAYLAGVSTSVITTLEKHGIIKTFNMQITRNPYEEKAHEPAVVPTLNGEQEKAYEGLKSLYNADKPAVSLLYGVTGSGKTAVYMKLIEHAVSSGGNVILLVPEISLTAQVTDSFVARFGSSVAVMHSGMSTGERYDAWKRVKDGKVNIVIGTRSAIFAPFEKVALIVIDEEQEHTYRSESTPRYNAKDVAKFRIAQSGGLLVLASATPSVESYALAQAGKYSYFELPERFGGSTLPNVKVIHLGEELERGNNSIIGVTLKEEIRKNLDCGKQTILFLNRRGYNTVLSCRSCGYVFECPSCSVPLTYHKANDMLMCHYCGYTANRPILCHDCGGTNIKYVGSGTQKLDEEIKQSFPDARVIRMDTDTTSYKMAHEKILGDFEAGKYDILIGTQMVTKGLNMPNVTLVGILLADGMLFSDDFRASERAFSMLTQVCGRAGRADSPGRAVIQTFSPDNNTIKLAKRQDYKAFFDEEIAFRKIMRFPPYCDIYQITLTGDDCNMVAASADKLCNKLKAEFEENKIKNIIMYPPLPSAIGKIAEKYRYRILIKCKDNKALRELMRSSVCDFTAHNGKISAVVDLNPLSTL